MREEGKNIGTGIFRVLWKPKELEGLGLPIIETVHPANVFVDPCITDIYKIQEARYIIEIMQKSIYNAELRYGEKAEAIIPGFDPVSGNIIKNIDRDNASYLHILIWTKYKDKKSGEIKIRLVEMSGCGVILKDTVKEAEKLEGEEKEKQIFPNDTYPYFFTPDMYRENTIWAKGSAELLLGISDQVDELDNQILTNARLAGNPIRLVSNSSGIDADKLTNEPGLVVPTNDINRY